MSQGRPPARHRVLASINLALACLGVYAVAAGIQVLQRDLREERPEARRTAGKLALAALGVAGLVVSSIGLFRRRAWGRHAAAATAALTMVGGALFVAFAGQTADYGRGAAYFAYTAFALWSCRTAVRTTIS